ncbi:MAG: hypothetical protein V7K55_18335 [Nostoc sp.]
MRARTLQYSQLKFVPSGQQNVNLPAYQRDRLKFNNANKFLLK